jgi:hypothetical protein
LTRRLFQPLPSCAEGPPLTMGSALLLLADATAAIASTHQNGDGDPMVPERCAMPAASTTQSSSVSASWKQGHYALSPRSEARARLAFESLDEIFASFCTVLPDPCKAWGLWSSERIHDPKKR